jgi:hypothetical protein
MDRKQKALRWVNRTGHGVEIGPCHNPIAPKAEGFDVHIIDHVTREQLIRKYEGNNLDVDKIEEVDFIWKGQSFAELTGKRDFYDWVIASHVIEHTPDLIDFLGNCDSILKEDGVLSLIVPDKRYCFDFYRPITGLARVIDSHVHRTKRTSAGTAAEYVLNFATQGGLAAWEAETPRATMHMNANVADAKMLMELAINDDKVYLDLHAWCFTPSSFRLIIHDLHCLGLIGLKEVEFFPTCGHEFHVTLGRSGKGIDCPRMELHDRIDRELAEAARCRRRAPKLLRTGRSLLGRGLRRVKWLFTQRSAA